MVINNDTQQHLTDDMGMRTLAMQVFRVPATTSWYDVVKYYDGVVKAPWQLVENGRNPVQGEVESPSPWDRRIWRAGKQALVVVLIGAPEQRRPEAYRVLMQGDTSAR